ncbi:ribosome hibernation-promoting factor, HPF/YfiA family [Aurantibacillus circumpalustris]|uniref:ribosome hibernation-promoting factor, HPF/YfiA family n=1 Tax=Aurantibacillus circumpalustris TaxID=3036359 RepID=UPI00295AACE8|nr:ribosome-associated translation inhibitor RaiA [Aurantibacillus circumpalustris]
MTINIQSVHFTADRKLLDFINEKVEKLNTFYDGIISGEVTLRLDKSSTSDNKISEVKILGKGQEFFAKKQCVSFEEATDLVCEALKTQIKKHKDKLIEHHQ